MSGYWIVNLAIWSVVLLCATRAAFVAAFMPKAYVRRGDPMRLAVWLVALLFTGHIVRWLWWPDSASLWKALYVVGAATGLYVLRLMIAYGRGDHVRPD